MKQKNVQNKRIVIKLRSHKSKSFDTKYYKLCNFALTYHCCNSKPYSESHEISEDVVPFSFLSELATAFEASTAFEAKHWKDTSSEV